MYTGTLIEELLATVERVEKHAQTLDESTELERWYTSVHQSASRPEHNLVGVA